jgi:hypothetical protein
MMKHWDIQRELIRFVEVSRSIAAMTMAHQEMPTASAAVTARPGAPNADWKPYYGLAGDEIIVALHKRITDMPSGLQIRFWINVQGRVTQIHIDRSSHDPSIDNIAEYQVLQNMQLPPPPSDMPMPLVLNVIIAPSGWIYSLDQPLQ